VATRVERPVANYNEGICSFCRKLVDRTDETAYEQITTWVQRPQMHGAVIREYTGRLAHEECIKKARDHIAADQQSLLEKGY